jgi:Protein of unknown function (DUF1553)/Protein of unknown function (DUF1549)/Planctomycete cytochrome C
MPCRCCRTYLLLLAPVLLLTLGSPAPAATPAEVAFFEKDVRPLLTQLCQRCHGPKKQENGLRLDSRAALLKGGNGGAVVIPGEPDKSLLIRAIRHDGELHMPPSKKLTNDQIALLSRWVRMGVPWPEDGQAAASTRSGPITAVEREFWSFQPIKDPPVPAVKDRGWPLTPIDHFIGARYEAEGVKPVSLADKRTLIRRLTYDLIGLPPTPEEIQAFLTDNSAAAYEKVVNRLLASPHYGERWGRHWLDVVRYADTAGDGADYPVREAYRYRNYVIAAFNKDKPFDQFLREQLAGDILARKEAVSGKQTPEQYAERVTATGYLAISKRYGYNLNTQFQHLDLADTIDNLGQSLLGLTLGCARCHDHKYDPITSADYYALYGILASSQFSFPGGEEMQRPRNLVPLATPEEVARQEARRQQELARVDAELKRLTEEEEDVAPLKQKRKQIAERVHTPLAYGVTEGKPANARIQQRGEPDKLGPEVPRRFLEVLGGDMLPNPAAGSGRWELAQWVTRPSNPLTARVIVNRIWQHHFGTGLVASPNDFGTRGDAPSHPELLDYLATRFMARGWSIKALHRQILLSRVYQLASRDDPDNLRRDQGNVGQAFQPDSQAGKPDLRLLWKYSRRPLDAEAIRDTLLAVSGKLDRTMPDAHPFPAVESWTFSIHYPFQANYDSNHRSVYLMVQRARRHPYLALFDGADPNLSTAERRPTTTPLQALYLMNAPFVHEQSAALAGRLLARPGDERERIRHAYELTTGREPDADEMHSAQTFLTRYRQKLATGQISEAQQRERAWAALARVLLTSNAALFVE